MKLVLIKEGQDVSEFPLEDGGNLIGRWDPDTKSFPEVDLEDFDTDALVSRRHAIITVKANQASLEDLGSTNGTFLLGGVKLEPGTSAVVALGGEFIVGNLRLKLSE